MPGYIITRFPAGQEHMSCGGREIPNVTYPPWHLATLVHTAPGEARWLEGNFTAQVWRVKTVWSLEVRRHLHLGEAGREV